MASLTFDDSRFDSAVGWVPFYRDQRFTQRYVIENGVFFSETLMNLRCSREKVVALLQGSWTWWNHGKVSNFLRSSDGSYRMDLKPIWWHLVKLHMVVYPPIPLKDADGVRLPIEYSRHFEGPGSMDVYAGPGSADAVVIRGRCHGVGSRVPFAPLPMVTKIHLGAEAGNLRFPFPKGTGWVGLYQSLET